MRAEVQVSAAEHDSNLLSFKHFRVLGYRSNRRRAVGFDDDFNAVRNQSLRGQYFGIGHRVNGCDGLADDGKIHVAQFSAHSVADRLGVFVVLNLTGRQAACGVVRAGWLAGEDAHAGSVPLIPAGYREARAGQQAASAHRNANPVQGDAAGGTVLKQLPRG